MKILAVNEGAIGWKQRGFPKSMRFESRSPFEHSVFLTTDSCTDFPERVRFNSILKQKVWINLISIPNKMFKSTIKLLVCNGWKISLQEKCLYAWGLCVSVRKLMTG
jgi:hypothetical protein